MTTLTVRVPVYVSVNDILGGTSCSQCDCPVALAIRRALPGETRVVAQPSALAGAVGRVELDFGTYADLPAALNEFALAFDAVGGGEPCEGVVEVRVPRVEAERFCERNGLPLPEAEAVGA